MSCQRLRMKIDDLYEINLINIVLAPALSNR